MSRVRNDIGQITTHSSDGMLNTLRTAHVSTECAPFAVHAQLFKASTARSDDAIGPLLAAATIPQDNAALAAQPIWITESLHRAYVTFKLFLMLHESKRRIDRSTRSFEHRLAVKLARNLHELVPGAEKTRNCANALRDTVCTLVTLFGPGVGELDVETDIDEVSLEGTKRRALVLLAHELVANAILHAFADRCRGRVIVSLRMISRDVALLCVKDDGIGICNDAINASGIAAGLVAVLKADIYYGRTPSGFTRIETVFKIA